MADINAPPYPIILLVLENLQKAVSHKISAFPKIFSLILHSKFKISTINIIINKWRDAEMHLLIA